MPTPILTVALLVVAIASTLGATQDTPPHSEAGARDEAGNDADSFAEVSMTAASVTVYAGEPIALTLTVALDADFLANQAVPLFRRPLDLPVQLSAAALDHLPGALPLPSPAASDEDERRLSFALNDDVVSATPIDEMREGRRFIVLTIRRRLVAEMPGELVIPAPTLRFAYATSFRQDFINERVATDRREVQISGKPITLTILPLPEDGRPLDFGGAVGSYTLSASAAPLELTVGESTEFVLVIEGTGNLPWFEPPALDELQGFHLLDQIQSVEVGRRAIGYELMLHDDTITAIPAISFSFFEPGPDAGYRTLTTQPIPLMVHA
jgi:hypothetical protein